MPEITIVGGALAGVRHAIEIVRLLSNSSTSLGNAEQKFKLAELTESLAETMTKLAELQIVLIEKDQKIKELDEAFQSKDLLIKVKDSYYEIDETRNATGDPYCMHCWEANHKKYHLHKSNQRRGVHICANCENEYWVDKEEIEAAGVFVEPPPRHRLT